MPDETRIRQILEELLESGASPEEACKGEPRLLEAVRVRLARLREVDEQLDRLFPTPVASRPNRRSASDAPRLACGLPPIPGYEIESLIGSGGMGAVYKARHLRLNRPVAIKTLLLGPYATQRGLDCLVREAEAVAALGHPNIVRVYDVGEVDGLPYFTMEYIDGGNLAQNLAGVPCPARRAAELLATLADAVQAAHSAGVVHRDLKPANVLLDASGTPKVADFSLARRLDTVPVPNMAGARMGTPSYMAPEQAAGELSAFSPAVDIYALGVLLYEFLTGRPPFHADSPAETQRQVIAEPPAPPTRLNARVPRDLETICMKCLEKDPARRYPTAAAVAEDARHFLRDEPIAARPVGAVERWARWTKRNPTGAGLLLAALVVLALLVGTGIREWTLQERRRAEFANWQERLDFVLVLQSEGRFTEARAILGRVPDAGSEALRGEIDQAVAALDLVERLEAIRLGRGRFVRGGGIDYEQSSRAYEFAFREAGFGGVGDDPAGVAARLAASPARTALVAAFDDWAACAAAEPRGWVLNVARRADPDPWRDRVRDQARWASVDHLEELAASVDPAAQPVTIMVAMGTRWRRLGGDPSGFLRRVYQAHPDDFWLNFELAHLSGERDLAAAIAYSRAALALRPDASAAHYNLAIYLARAGRPADATHHLRRTLESDPTHAWAQSLLASMLTESHSLAEAAREWDNAVRLEPENPAWRTQWRSTLTSLGRGREVIDEWRSRLDESARAHAEWDGYAELCLYVGDAAEYRRACDELLSRFESSSDPHVWERVGRACLFVQGTPDQARRGAELIDRALEADPESYAAWAHPYFQFAHSLAEYRLGRYEAAVEALRSGASGVLRPAPQLVLAMALHRLGRTDEAKHSLARAVSAADWRPTRAVSREDWMYHLLRREAEAMILPDLAAMAAGERPPIDNDERLTLAALCIAEGRAAAAAQLFFEVFADAPEYLDDPASDLRFIAACQAAVAAAGGLDDATTPDESGQALWRARARDWLRKELAAWAAPQRSGDPGPLVRESARLARWRDDPDLASLRSPDALARLTPQERDECTTLWNAVETAIRDAP